MNDLFEMAKYSQERINAHIIATLGDITNVNK